MENPLEMNEKQDKPHLLSYYAGATTKLHERIAAKKLKWPENEVWR